VRWPILNRKLNTRDWDSQNLLMDDFALILQESLRAELSVTPRMYQVSYIYSELRQADSQDYSVVLIVPDHGDKAYVEEMTRLILGVMGFKEVAVHQVSFPFRVAVKLTGRKRTLLFSAPECQQLVLSISGQTLLPCHAWTKVS